MEKKMEEEVDRSKISKEEDVIVEDDDGDDASSADDGESDSTGTDGESIDYRIRSWMGSAFVNTPQDVLIQILLWLPVMSLLRFKSVSKSWRALIQSPIFIAQHLHLRTNTNHFLFNIGQYTRRFLLLSEDNDFEVPKYFDIPHVPHAKADWRRRSPGPLCPSCDGIVCMHESLSREVALFNPATRQFRILPQSAVPLNSSASYTHPGFGFDAKVNDYKVVKISFYRDPNNAAVFLKLVEVLNLTTDTWRTIEDAVLPVDSIDDFANTTYRNGIFYWVAENYYETPQHVVKPNHSILSFDLTREVFGTTPLPLPEPYKSMFLVDFSDELKLSEGYLPPYLTSFPRLSLLRDKIAFCNQLHDPVTHDPVTYHISASYEIWVLNEWGVKQSWTKLYTIKPFSGIRFKFVPFGFSKDGEFLLMSTESSQGWELVLCNLVTQEIKKLHINPYGLSIPFVGNYKETLVSVSNKGRNVTSDVQYHTDAP